LFVSQTTLFVVREACKAFGFVFNESCGPNAPVRFLLGDNVAKAPKTSPSRKPWSSDDVKMLKSMARKEPASAIAKSLKRTEGATRQKATALGVSLNTTRGRAVAAKSTARKTVARKAAPKKAATKKTAAKKSARKA
jgi:hypothetical protein